MLSLNEIQKHLTAIVFNDEATISGLLHVVIAFAVLWFIVFAIVKAVIRKLIGPNPKWLIHAIDKDYERGGKKTLKDLQINMTKSEYITFALRDWPRLQVCRHLFKTNTHDYSYGSTISNTPIFSSSISSNIIEHLFTAFHWVSLLHSIASTHR